MDYVYKTKATMHLEHRPGETTQVDWAGDTMGIVDTDTRELIPALCILAISICYETHILIRRYPL